MFFEEHKSLKWYLKLFPIAKVKCRGESLFTIPAPGWDSNREDLFEGEPIRGFEAIPSLDCQYKIIEGTTYREEI